MRMLILKLTGRLLCPSVEYVRAHRLDSRDVQHRILHVAGPLDGTALRDLEDEFRDDGRVVADGSAADDVFARKARVAEAVHRIGEVSPALQIDSILTVVGQIDGQLGRTVHAHVDQHVDASDPDRRRPNRPPVRPSYPGTRRT